MPVPSPFHERTAALCHSLFWKDWSGYHAVRSYDTCHSREYMAFRHTAGVIDVSPLFKYEVSGPDATRFLSLVIAKDISRLRQGQVTYCCWCDEKGKLMDDGTVTRFEENRYRVTAAEPSLHWFHRYSRGFRVEIEDSTARFGALAIQGPAARQILQESCAEDPGALKFFWSMENRIDDRPVVITRTGYTGDLGYEVWCAATDALPVWDGIMAAGAGSGLQPAGLDALDVTRVEAGFIMNGVDYVSANHCMIESRMSTPYEIGLGWTVNLDRDPFIGQAALRREKERGPRRHLVGLDIDWVETENLYAAHNLPPEVGIAAWRCDVPVFSHDGRQIGYATSGSWSPILKKNLALAHVQPGYHEPGTLLKFEIMVEHERKQVKATVCRTPFFNPERKRKSPHDHARR